MDELQKEIYAVLLINFKEKGPLTEPELRREFDEMEGKGALERKLGEVGARLPEVLSSFKDFKRCGNKWGIFINENASAIVDTMNDQKRKKGSSRGGSAPRRGFADNRRFQRGNSHTHGSAFRPQSTQSFSSQRPLQRNGPVPPQPSHNRNDSYSDKGSNHHRAQSPYRSPTRHRSPPLYRSPPRQRSPPRDWSPRHHNSSQHYRSASPPINSYRPYHDDRDYDSRNDQRSSGVYDDRNYGNSYNQYGSRRQSFSPDRRGYSPVHRTNSPGNRRNYQDERQRSPDRRRRSPNRRRSPENYGNPSDYRGSYSVNREPSPDNIRRAPSRYASPPPPPPPQRCRSDFGNPASGFQDGSSREYRDDRTNNASNSQQSHRNEYPPRAESSLSYSSIEEVTSRPSSRAETRLPTESELAIAKSYNASVNLFEDKKAAKSIAKEVRRYMTSSRYPSPVLLEELLAYVEKVVIIPGETAEEKENYIANLKNILPEILDELHVDLENAHIKWGRSVVDENGYRSISTFAEDAKEDEMFFRILNHLKTLPSWKFSCSEVIIQLMNITGEQDQDFIRRKLTFILFEKLKGTYSYVSGSKDIIEKHETVSSSGFYDAPLVHKMLQDSPKKALNVTLRRFLSFKKFSVCPVDSLAELEDMEKELEALAEDNTANLNVAPAGGWKLNHGCLVKYNANVSKWARGFLYRTETNNTGVFRVYLLDFACVQLHAVKDLLVLPQKYLTIPPYAIPCSLFAEEFVIAAMETQYSDTFRSYPKEFVIEPTGERLNDDVKTFAVNLYTSGVNGSRKNILDEI